MPDKHEVGASTPLEPTSGKLPHGNSHVKRHGRQKGHWKLNKEENEQVDNQ